MQEAATGAKKFASLVRGLSQLFGLTFAKRQSDSDRKPLNAMFTTDGVAVNVAKAHNMFLTHAEHLLEKCQCPLDADP